MKSENKDNVRLLSANFDVHVAEVKDDRPAHIVIALHGIRDDSSWSYELLENLSHFEDKLIIAPVSYGRVSTFSFLANINSRKVDNKVSKRMNSVKKIHPNSPISILCHSNGTKILSRVLENLDFIPEYIFTIGSVCHQDDCDKFVVNRRMVNECGIKDIYPIIAETIRPDLFGSTGVFGFNNYPIMDRHFVYSHSDGLAREHFEKYLIPIIINGKIERIEAKKSKIPKHTSYYVRRFAIFVFFIFALYVLYRIFT